MSGWQKLKKGSVFLYRPVVGCSTDQLLNFTSPIFFKKNFTFSASRCVTIEKQNNNHSKEEFYNDKITNQATIT